MLFARVKKCCQGGVKHFLLWKVNYLFIYLFIFYIFTCIRTFHKGDRFD